jgi:hypothetical protein
MAARGRKIVERLTKWTHGQATTFLTLTLVADGKTLIQRFEHLTRSFARLRATKFWKKRVRAGAAVVEITLGANGGHWHVHLHCLCLAAFMDQATLSTLWSKCSRGSFIVHLRRCRDKTQDIRYTAKYATKGWSNEVSLDHDKLVECIVSLRGRRMLWTFGAWRRIELEKSADDGPTEWRRWRFRDVATRAAAGDKWAVGILRSIGVVARCESSGICFDTLEQKHGGQAARGAPVNRDGAIDCGMSDGS